MCVHHRDCRLPGNLGTASAFIQPFQLRDQLTLVLLVAGTGPEVPNLLGPDVAGSERRAIQRRGGDLEDGKRGSELVQELRHSGDAGNQRREGDAEALPKRGQGQQMNRGCLHRGEFK